MSKNYKGPSSYRELQRQNRERFDRIKDLPEIKKLPTIQSKVYTPMDIEHEGPTQSALLRQTSGKDYLGNSFWDPETLSAETAYNTDRGIENARGENQWGIVQLGNGIAKGVILAGTTFLEGTVGLITGIANLGQKGGFWDNAFNRAMQSVNDWAEEVLPNYYTNEELNSPWYTNILSANFIGDKFLKNLGFTVGAFYSGGVASMALKALRIPKLINLLTRSTRMAKHVTSLLGAGISAVNEGSIEALNNSKDWYNLQKAQLDDIYIEELEKAKIAYEETGNEVAYQQALATINDAYKNKLNVLEEDRLNMGNADLLMNIPILTASNLLQFGRLYANGFKTGRRNLNIYKRYLNETEKAAGKDVGKTAAKTATKETAEATGKETAETATKGATKKQDWDSFEYATDKATKWGKTWAVIKNPLSEGNEEIMQKAASEVAGNYYANYSTDVNNFYEAGKDRTSAEIMQNWIKANADGFIKTYGDGSSWEEFFIGAITGALGMPKFRSMRDSEGKLRSPITLEGGIREEYREYMDKMNRQQQITDYLNSRKNSKEFQNYWRGLSRHLAMQRAMDEAILKGDKFEFDNAEFQQMVSDIAMFDFAGKLEDLKGMVEEAVEPTDENIDTIIERTKQQLPNGKTISAFTDANNNGYIDSSGNVKDREAVKKRLQQSKQELFDTIELYKKTAFKLDQEYGEQFTDDQLTELTWMKAQIENWKKRSADLADNHIGKTIGILDKKFRINNDIRNKMGQHVAAIQEDPLYMAADKNANLYKDTIKLFEQVRVFKGEDLVKVLTHPKSKHIVDLLKNIIESDTERFSEEEKKQALIDINDLQRLVDAQKTFEAKIKEYLKNPNSLEKAHEEADKKREDKEFKQKSKGLKDSLSKAENIKEFRDILSQEEDDNIKDKIIEELEAEGNKIATQHREFKEYRDAVELELSKQDDKEAVNDAIALFNEHELNSDTLEDLANTTSVHLDNEHAFDEDSNNDIELSTKRFAKANAVIKAAMEATNNIKKYKDRFKRRYEEPSDKNDKDNNGETVEEFPVKYFTKNGMKVSGKYIKKTDSKGNSIVAYEGDPKAQIVIDSKDLGLSDKDLIGSKKDRTTADEIDFYERLVLALKNQRLRIVSAKKTANGEYEIVTNEGGFTIKGEAAKKIFERYFIKRGQDKSNNDEDYPYGDEYPFEQGVGNITVDELDKETDEIANSTADRKKADKKYYRPAIPEFGIDESRNRDFRDFSEVKPSFKEIYEHLKTNGAFDYVNKGNLHPGDEIFFMIDPEFEETVKDKDWHKEPVIFMVVKDEDNEDKYQIVGSLDSGKSVDNFIGLRALRDKVIQEYNESESKDGKFIASPKTKVSKIMIGKVPYDTEEKSLRTINGISENTGNQLFAIIRNGTFVTNGEVSADQIVGIESMAKREGRLYLLIPNGAGKYSPVAVRVKHFNAKEFNIYDATIGDNKKNIVGANIKSAITALAQSKSKAEMVEAIKRLQGRLFLRDIRINWVTEGGVGLVIGKVAKDENGEIKTDKNGHQIYEDKDYIYFTEYPKKITNADGLTLVVSNPSKLSDELKKIYYAQAVTKSEEEIIKEITDKLMSFNLPLQVSIKGINKVKDYNKTIIDSDVTTANISEAAVKDCWFTTDYFDNNLELQEAENPPSKYKTLKPLTPVGGSNSVTPGTKVVGAKDGKTYYVDINERIIRDEDGNEVATTKDNKILFDLAWAENIYGNSTTGVNMFDNKCILPDGKRGIDRTEQRYLTEEELKELKDSLKERLPNEPLKGVKVAQEIIEQILKDQELVDKESTTKNFYNILEEDGNYHNYDRVHSRIGSNYKSNISAEDQKVLDDIEAKLNEFIEKKDLVGYQTYLKNLAEIYKVNLELYTELNNKNVSAVVNTVRDKILDINSQRSLEAGTSVDTVVRDFFALAKEINSDNVNDYINQLQRPSNLSKVAFNQLCIALVDLKKTFDSLGETVYANNLVIFKKYADGTRIAGELDILTVNENGEFKIYDIKTALNVSNMDKKFSFQTMSNKEYYSLQLSAYSNLLEAKYGVKATNLALIPFELTYQDDSKLVTDIQHKKHIGLKYNKDVNVPNKDLEAPNEPNKPNEPQNEPNEDFVNEEPIFNKDAESLVDSSRDLTKDAKGKEIILDSNNNLTGYMDLSQKLADLINENNPTLNMEAGTYKVKLIPFTFKGPDGSEVQLYIAKRSRVIEDSYGDNKIKRSVSDCFVVAPNGTIVDLILGLSDVTLKDVKNLINESLSAKGMDYINGFLNTNRNPLSKLAADKEAKKSLTPEIEPINDNNPSNSEENKAADTLGTIAASQEQGDEFNNDDLGDDSLLRKVDTTTNEDYKVWNEKEELAWLDEVLPQLNDKERLQFKEGLIEVAKAGGYAWGQFSNGVMTLSNIAAEGTLYHEAFHAVFHLMLDANDQNALLQEYAAKNPKLSDTVELEEALAENFREFVMQGGKDTRGLGRKIIDFFKSLFIKTKFFKSFRPSSIYYFNKINKGGFANKVLKAKNNNNQNNQENFEIKLYNKIQKLMRQLYPEIELNFTDEINPEDIKLGIEEYKALHPEVETLTPFQLDKDRILGVADLDALSVLIDRVHQKQDTLPHEYAHHYINWFRNSDLVQEGIKRFGSEESLVQAIGEQVVKQKGRAYHWWQRFTNYILNLFNRDQRLLNSLTHSFLTRANLTLQKSINGEINLAYQNTNNQQKSEYENKGYTQEMIDILETAPRDKQGRLLAPNGKVSNLNERQYVHVRTKAFKEWFGDWEKAARNSKLTIYDFVKSLDKTLLKNTTFSDSKITNSVFHVSKNKVAVFSKNYNNTNAPDTELGYFFAEDLDTITSLREIKHYQGAKDILGHNVHIVDINLKNPLRVDSYMSTLPVELGYTTIEELSKLTSQEKHELYKKIREDLKNKGYDGIAYVLGYEVDEDGFPERSIGYVVFDNDNIKVKDIKDDSNFTDFSPYENVSKVVDENGEPLVVYHGNRTDNKITTFDLSRKGTEHKERAISGFWFTTDKDIAKEEYALKPESIGKGIKYLQYGEIIPVFLNIKNPVETEQQGITVNDTPYGIFTTAKEKLNDFIDRSKALTRENTDGYILTLVDSDNRADDFVSKQIQLVVNNPNQIKSATDNIGTYSKDNDDIRYQKEDNNINQDGTIKSLESMRTTPKIIDYNSLDIRTKNELEQQGLTEEEFNRLSEKEKDAIIECAAF